MKTFKLALLMILISTTGLFAQTAYNPFTQNIHFDPEPSAAGFECGSTPSVEFTQGITTAADATQWQTQPLIVTICVTGFTFAGQANGATAASVVSGSYAANFDWAFDSFAPNCLIGTQNQTLPGTGTNPINPNPLSSGDIKVALEVPSTSPISTVLAVNVNLQVPGYMSQFNSGPDDNESTQTQTFCPLKISGGVFLDTSVNNGNLDITDPIGTLDGEVLYANLVGPNGNVVAVVPIDSVTGQYEFTNVSENTMYTVMLTSTPGTVGSTTQPSLPIGTNGGWNNTAEDCCDGVGEDGNNDGALTVSVTNASVEQANFGVWDATPTPVEMSHFSVSEYNCNTLVAWTTQSEENVSHFEVLRKDPGSTEFIKIAKFNSKGNSSSQKLYSYVDKEVEKNETAYQYKIKSVDIDAQYEYSTVRSIKLTCGGDEASVQLFPNPAIDNINLVYTTEDNDLQIVVDVLDITGRNLSSTTQIINKGTSVINMDIKSLAVGQYMVRYHIVETNETATIKFTKE